MARAVWDERRGTDNGGVGALSAQEAEFYKKPTNAPEYWRALQFESEILPHKEIELVGALPEELGAFVNLDVAVAAHAQQAAAADAFLRFVTSAKAAQLWQAGGLTVKGH